MTATIEGLREYLGGTAVPDDLLQAMLDAAVARVPPMVTDMAEVPPDTADLAAYAIAAELVAHRNSTGGVLAIGADGQATRLGLDPTRYARSILADYLAWPVA